MDYVLVNEGNKISYLDKEGSPVFSFRSNSKVDSWFLAELDAKGELFGFGNKDRIGIKHRDGRTVLDDNYSRVYLYGDMPNILALAKAGEEEYLYRYHLSRFN